MCVGLRFPNSRWKKCGILQREICTIPGRVQMVLILSTIPGSFPRAHLSKRESGKFERGRHLTPGGGEQKDD